MKINRLVLACTLLLLASVPAFALPQCGECVNNECVPSSTSFTPCRYDATGACEIYFRPCSSFAPEPVLADWTVASVEISRPAQESDLAAIPADAAEACTLPSAEGK